MNRKTPPSINPVTGFLFKKPEVVKTSSGNSVYFFNDPSNDALKIDLVFGAGTTSQSKALQAKATLKNIFSGTEKLTQYEIANGFDNFGTYTDVTIGEYHCEITLFCTAKHFKDCWPLFISSIMGCIFPKSEVAIYNQNGYNKLLTEKQKTSYWASRKFNELLFKTPLHPGFFYDETDYLALDSSTLSNFHHQNINSEKATILVAGGFNDEIKNTILSSFSEGNYLGSDATYTTIETSNDNKSLTTKVKGAVQASICAGNFSISRTHPDFLGLTLVNLILGGYFGSRLMKNIREDKGLTYGIHSLIKPYKQGFSVFSIKADIEASKSQLVLDEIKYEMDFLRNNPISVEELNSASEFLIGSVQRSLDGVFSMSDRQMFLLNWNLDYDYFDLFFKTIKNCTPDSILDLSKKYLQPETLSVSLAVPE